MIGSKDLVTLLSLLSEDKPLETISTTFNRTFNKNDHLKIGCALYTMIKDGFVKVPTHRLISLYLLYTQFNHSKSSSTTTGSTNSYDAILDYPIAFNPFLPIFIDELEKQLKNQQELQKLQHQEQQADKKQLESQQQQQQQSIYFNPIEKHYLIQFLTNLPKDYYSKRTSKDIINQQVPNELAVPDLNLYRRFYLEKLAHHSFPSLRSIGVSPIIFLQGSTIFNNKLKNNTQQQQQQEQQNTLQDTNITTNELSLFSFEPIINRPAPPIHEPIDTLWLNTTMNHGLLLAPINYNSDNNPKKVVRDLMSRAIRGRLMKSQLLQIKKELDNDPKLVLYSGLVPKKLPNLVENNTQVAIEALLKLIHSPDFKDYFQELVSMEMNYRSMEVVNALATSVELPQHFIHMYISNCIVTCNNTSDKAMLQRLVRLVCVFIQSLIRNNIINIKDLFTEVQHFCLEHSKIREAISLFKLMSEEK